ncbi:hypothetical protein M0804_004732 [Polistes exclamans]|nr:hypothetical protein M0804_004732 [Polistes exclamans]
MLVLVMVVEVPWSVPLNVLRELEQKKPQLDELVHTAENLRADTNRQQLHGKGKCFFISFAFIELGERGRGTGIAVAAVEAAAGGSTCNHRIPIMSQHRRGSVHGASPVPGHPTPTASSSSSNSNLPISTHEIQTRGIPLPGMVAPSRSIHGSPMHGNPIHGGCSLEGSEKVVQQGGPTSSSSGSPYSSHGSPMRTPMSSGHGTPQDSPHVTRHRRDSEHSSTSPPIGGNITSRRGSTDVIIGPSSIQDGHHHPSGSPGARSRRRSDYSPHQEHDSILHVTSIPLTIVCRIFGGTSSYDDVVVVPEPSSDSTIENRKPLEQGSRQHVDRLNGLQRNPVSYKHGVPF